MNRTAYVKLTLVLFGFAALLAAFEDGGFLPALGRYSFQLMIAVLGLIVLEAYVAPWMRRRLGVRGRSGAGSSYHTGYSGDGPTGGASDCGGSDPGGGGDSGGGGGC